MHSRFRPDPLLRVPLGVHRDSGKSDYVFGAAARVVADAARHFSVDVGARVLEGIGANIGSCGPDVSGYRDFRGNALADVLQLDQTFECIGCGDVHGFYVSLHRVLRTVYDSAPVRYAGDILWSCHHSRGCLVGWRYTGANANRSG